MDERDLSEFLKAEEIPPADDKARKSAINLALATFDEAQREKKHQGFGFLRRLTGRSKTHPGERLMTRRLFYGGLVTTTAVILTLVTYRTMPLIERVELKPAPTAASSATTARKDESGAVSGSTNELDKAAGTAQSREPTPAAPVPMITGQDAPAAKPAPVLTDQLRRQSPSSSMGGLVAREKQAAPAARAYSGMAKSLQSGDQVPHQQYEAVGRDQFASVAENAVKRTAEEPVSTFSIDVDTASYSFVRRMLMQGRAAAEGRRPRRGDDQLFPLRLPGADHAASSRSSASVGGHADARGTAGDEARSGSASRATTSPPAERPRATSSS